MVSGVPAGLDARTAALLFLAAAGGGGLNSVVGGGSFVTFPALLFAGVPALVANATSTLALWPGGVASAVAYRAHLGGSRRVLLGFAAASLVGGLAGSILLLETGEAAFQKLVPWLLLVATLLFTFGPRVLDRYRKEPAASGDDLPARTFALGVGTQLLVALYGGYFGGGMGILMLATFSLLGMTDIHRMNGLRNVLATVINGTALIAFVGASVIDWNAGLVMVAGTVAGGYAGAALAARARPPAVRAVVTFVAWSLTAFFFVRGV
jgi:uncharacterized membrane protein YfcA